VKALVVFCNIEGRGHPLGWMLKDGFKHCFINLQTEDGWVEFDYGTGIPHVSVMAASDFDLNSYYQSSGFTTVETEQSKSIKFGINLFCGTITVANCVGLVKALLGVKYFSVTPYQLYKRLIK
jgi:hypothetical protein